MFIFKSKKSLRSEVPSLCLMRISCTVAHYGESKRCRYHVSLCSTSASCSPLSERGGQLGATAPGGKTCFCCPLTAQDYRVTLEVCSVYGGLGVNTPLLITGNASECGFLKQGGGLLSGIRLEMIRLYGVSTRCNCVIVLLLGMVTCDHVELLFGSTLHYI